MIKAPASERIGKTPKLPASNFWLPGLGLALALLAGCGGKANRPPMGRVSGKVTYLGQPVVRATITFIPLAKGERSATAITDENGEYHLSTFGNRDGAVVGTHQVGIALRGPSEAKAPAHAGGAYLEEMEERGGKPLIPEHYFSPTMSGLSKDVEAGSNQFDFVLHDRK